MCKDKWQKAFDDDMEYRQNGNKYSKLSWFFVIGWAVVGVLLLCLINYLWG